MPAATRLTTIVRVNLRHRELRHYLVRRTPLVALATAVLVRARGDLVSEASAAEVRRLRSAIDHPIVDGDGHLIESLPAFTEAVQKVGGPGAGARLLSWLRDHPLTTMGDAERGDQRGAWWGVTNDALDLATVMAPRLLAERLEEIGLDYAILYPTLGLALPTIPDKEMRRLACRAVNTMNAELTRSCSAHLTAAACIPMHTPEEAVVEGPAQRLLGQ